METIKLSIIAYNDWLEATWTKEVTISNDVEKDGELVQEESVTTEQVHCESFSGHREHIAMLRLKALEFGTSLDDYEDLIAECENNFIAPTEEEIQAEITATKVQEAKSYLASTDYKMTIDYFATLSKEEQDSLVKERAEKREFVRLNEGAK